MPERFAKSVLVSGDPVHDKVLSGVPLILDAISSLPALGKPSSPEQLWSYYLVISESESPNASVSDFEFAVPSRTPIRTPAGLHSTWSSKPIQGEGT